MTSRDFDYSFSTLQGTEFATGILDEEQEPTHKKLFRDDHLWHLESVARHLQSLVSLELKRKGSTEELEINDLPVKPKEA